MFDELDALIGTPKAEPKAPAAEPPKTPPAAATPKPGESKVEPPPVTPPVTPPTAQTPKALREYSKRMEDAAKNAESKVAELERKLADAEKRGKDTSDITERLAAAEKRREDVEKQLYAMNIGESPEFKKQYDQPWRDAADYAKEIVERLEVTTQRDEDTGQATATRPAVWNEDFAPIYQLARQSISKATQQAKALFGDDFQTVMNHVQELHRLERLRGKALSDLQANADTERQTRTAEAAKQREWTETAWTRINQELSEKNPDLFQADPKDAARAEIWNKSIALVEPAFTGAKSMTPIQKVTLDANVRLRAAAFPVLKYDLNKAHERIAELEAQLDEALGSKPGDTQRPGGDSTAPAPKKTFSEELASLDA